MDVPADSSTDATLVIRASSTSDYADCPRRWAARNLRKDVAAAGYTLRSTDIGIASAIGTAVHSGAAHALAEKAMTGQILTINTAIDHAMANLNEAIAGGLTWDEATPHRRDSEVQVRRMMLSWQRGIADTITPVSIEARLEAIVAPGVRVSGQHDVLGREAEALIDLKTGRHRVNCKPQLGIYALLARTHGYAVGAVHEHWVPRTPISQPQRKPGVFRHDLAAAEAAGLAILRRIQQDVRSFRHGDEPVRLDSGNPWAFVANPSSRLCSARWCAAWGTDFCREHRAD